MDSSGVRLIELKIEVHRDSDYVEYLEEAPVGEGCVTESCLLHIPSRSDTPDPAKVEPAKDQDPTEGNQSDSVKRLRSKPKISKARLWQCYLCKQTAKRRLHLSYHFRLHSGLRPFECGECGKHFTRETNLEVHMRTHTKVQPYMCFVCDKAFAQASNLVTHTRLHKG